MSENTIVPSLPGGWTELRLTREEGGLMDVWYNASKLVSMDVPEAFDTLTVVGSNVTVNCSQGKGGSVLYTFSPFLRFSNDIFVA